MNIKDNIVNYLFDRDYVVCFYDEHAYFFNYKYLDSFKEQEIVVSLSDRRCTLRGEDLTIVKMTKKELLVKGRVDEMEVSMKDE